jgi:hypothetical protein
MRTARLTSNTSYPFIATWNGTNLNTATGLKISSLLKSVVLSQIGAEAASLFEDDFINYNQGYILCQSIPDDLNKIFASTNNVSFRNLQKSISFIVVRMPATFIGQKGNLSKNYEYGERLKVSVSIETLPDTDKGIQVPTINGVAAQRKKGPIKNKKAGVGYMIYRDANFSARTLKSQSGGGTGIGVWS